MDKLSFFKLLRSELKKFGQEINFTLDKSRTLINEKETILHIIDFDPGTFGFACDIAVQPLYVDLHYLITDMLDVVNQGEQSVARKLFEIEQYTRKKLGIKNLYSIDS